jgi:hypothetical protein
MGGEVTMPASEDRAEHVSLLRWQLEPESARTARVTKQSPVPVTAFLTCAALFFTACVGVLVVGSRPAVPGVVLPLSSLQSRRDASAAGERALMESLRFDERWYDQGNTLDAIKIDHEREGLGATSQADFPTQAGFEAWRGAPYWQHFREIPVSFNRPAKEMRDEPLVVVGHATDRGDAPLWLSSLRRHALPAATSGEGTWWHGDEDKRMGLKAALITLQGLNEGREEGHERMREDALESGFGGESTRERGTGNDPVVAFTDTADALFACDAREMLLRFEAADADVLISREGDGGAIIGRASKMLELVRDFESFLLEAKTPERGKSLGAGAAWSDFYKSCAPSADASASAQLYDDRVCLSRYLSERAAAGDARVKRDVRGSLLVTVGGADARRETLAAAPCVFHFSDPTTKALMKPMAAKFPGVLV